MRLDVRGSTGASRDVRPGIRARQLRPDVRIPTWPSLTGASLHARPRARPDVCVPTRPTRQVGSDICVPTRVSRRVGSACVSRRGRPDVCLPTCPCGRVCPHVRVPTRAPATHPTPRRAAGRDTQRSGPAAARVAHSPGQRPIDRAHDAPTTPPLPPHRTHAKMPRRAKRPGPTEQPPPETAKGARLLMRRQRAPADRYADTPRIRGSLPDAEARTRRSPSGSRACCRNRSACRSSGTRAPVRSRAATARRR